MKKKIHEAIVKAVADYRGACKAKQHSGDRPMFRMQMDRSAGKLEVLAELDPENEAFKTTGWSGI